MLVVPIPQPVVHANNAKLHQAVLTQYPHVAVLQLVPAEKNPLAVRQKAVCADTALVVYLGFDLRNRVGWHNGQRSRACRSQNRNAQLISQTSILSCL